MALFDTGSSGDRTVSWLWFGLVYGKQDMKGMDWKEKKIQDVKENLILRF
jgi:hypothetical protein